MEKTHRLDVAVVDGAPVADDALQTLHDVIHGGAAAALLLAVVVDHGGHRQHRSHLQGVVLQQLLQNKTKRLINKIFSFFSFFWSSVAFPQWFCVSHRSWRVHFVPVVKLT